MPLAVSVETRYGKTMPRRIALLHPGDMGVTVGACASAAGNWIGWAADGRGETTRRRAERAAFTSYSSLEKLLAEADTVISVCPPVAAKATAKAVAELAFRGLYVDANAVSPRTAEVIAQTVEHAGATYVDAGIIGPPARERGTTRLYVSGEQATEVAACFAGSALEATDIGSSPTAASALKMCYAAWTKGSAALLLAVGALARAERVETPLRAEWERSQPGLNAQLQSNAATNTAKAWRFVGEMREVADTFEAAGLSGAFHRGAEQIYAMIGEYKGAGSAPELDEVLQTMLGSRTLEPPP